MAIGEIVYSLITLILLSLVIFSPFIRKMIKSAAKHSKGESIIGDNFDESIDSHRVVERILSDQESGANITFSEPDQLKSLVVYETFQKRSSIVKIDRMKPLKRAILWKEILDKPVGLREQY